MQWPESDLLSLNAIAPHIQEELGAGYAAEIQDASLPRTHAARRTASER